MPAASSHYYLDDDIRTTAMAANRPARDYSSQARRLTILDLPKETHKEIVNHCNMPELVCLALVSRRFHHLAAEVMYRTLHFSLPYHGGKLYEDTLAACLNTLTTSEYDYARHLRELVIGSTYGAGPEADRTISPYVYTESCGKFLNTLLLLTLRKAKGLEKFNWDVRIELSRPVFKVLHQIAALSDVQIRLQKGPSMHGSMPRLPLSPPMSSSEFTPHSTSAGNSLDPGLSLPSFSQQAQFQPPPSSAFAPVPATSAFYNPSLPTSSLTPPQPKIHVRGKLSRQGLLQAEPQTISGFKNLKVLSILDIDNLDVITEIKPCLRNSTGTLTELSVSFSDALASRARNLPPDADSDESDIDDIDFGVPLVNAALADGSMATDHAPPMSKLFYAQEERQMQESALSRIFGLEPFLLRHQPKPEKASTDSGTVDANGPSDRNSSRVAFANAVRDMTVQLLNSTVGGSSTGDRLKMLDIIETAAKKYIDSEVDDKDDQEKKEGSQKTVDAHGSGSSLDNPAEDDDKLSASGVSLFRDGDTATRPRTTTTDVNPEDIDVEEPEGQLMLEDGSCDRGLEDSSDKDADPEQLADSASVSVSGQGQESHPGQSSTDSQPERHQQHSSMRTTDDDSTRKLAGDISAQRNNFEALLDRLATLEKRAHISRKGLEAIYSVRDGIDPQILSDMETREYGLHKDIRRLFQETRTVAAEVRDIDASNNAVAGIHEASAAAEGSDAAQTAHAHRTRRLVDKYVRSTRGLALEELNLCLIPTTASVLSKAIDLHVLVRITLLNVGPQAPIWALFSRENRAQPLPLRSIFTDNVSTVFLVFVAQLEEVHSLFMLERDAHQKSESLSPKTTVSIDDIRHVVLKKHARHLKKLMISNSASQDWDVDEATIQLLGRRARNLRELAVILNMPSIHRLMLHLPNFVSLVALNIIRLRTDGACVLVMQETKRFLLDMLAQYPHLKLKWLAIDNSLSIECIKRLGPKKTAQARIQTSAKKSQNSKGKEKAKSAHWTGPAISSMGINESPGDSAAGKQYDSSDNSDSSSAPYKQVKLKLEHCHVDDAWGISIFDRVIMAGRI